MLQGAIRLASRGLLRVGGADAESFLQGLITKDIGCVSISGVIYSFLLNARGRIVSDLLIYRVPSIGGLLLETDSQRLKALERTLAVYRMRRKVELELLGQHSVHFSPASLANTADTNSANVYADPRLPSFGYRIIGEEGASDSQTSSESSYVERRLDWGIAEGFEEVGDQIPLQMNGDLLDGISFEKGCYIGQELVARTHHTGTIRRRVLPIRSANDGKIVGKTLYDENKKRQGKVLRTLREKGIGLVALDHLGKTLLDEAGNRVEVLKPIWWPEKHVS